MSISRIVKFSLIICIICSCQSYAQQSQDTSSDVPLNSNNNQTMGNQYEIFERWFSNPSGSTDDLTTGNSPYTAGSPTNLHSREKVTTLSFTLTKPRKNRQIYRYEDGLLISRYYSASDVDPDTIYEYDTLRRCIKAGQDFTYSYPENNNSDERERTAYYIGKFSSTEIITISDNGYEIYTKRSDSTETLRKFIYENGLLIHVMESYPKEGREWNWYDFTYENGLLRKIVNAMNRKDDIRSIIEVLSYDGTNLSETKYQRFRQGALETVEYWKYLNYDEYGNWHDAECYSDDGTLIQKYHRDIEYT